MTREAHTPDATLATSRADFAMLVQSYQNHWHSKLGGVPFIGSLALAWVGMSAVETLGWPVITQWVIFAAGWAVGLMLAWGVSRRMLRRHGLVCPSCGAALADTVWPRGRDRAVLASGMCPTCALPIFPAES